MYAHGRGRVVMRAQVAFEEVKGDRTAIVVTELPYQVNKASLLEKIAELVKDKRIDGIGDLRDESDRDGMRIYIELKRDANPHKVLNNLFKHTPMQLAFNMNMLALVDGQPQTLPLRSVLVHYLDHRREIIRRRTEFDLGKARARAHILEGLKIALDNLDAVIKTIRESAEVDDARTNLMTRFDLSELQAQAILDMRLARLAALERQKIEDEYLAIIQLIAELEDILANPARVSQIIKDELTELKKKYAGERRTRVADDFSREMTDEDLIADEDVVVTISGRGYIKRQPVATYRRQHRGGKGIIGHVTREEDAVEHLLVANTHDWALFFTNRGRVFSAKVHDDPRRQPPGQGHPDHQPAGRPGRVGRGPDGDDHAARLQGRARTSSWPPARASSRRRRSSSSRRSARRGSGRSSSRDDDELAWVDVSTGEDDVIIATAQGKLARFSEGEVRAMGRDAAGVIGIRLARKGDSVVGHERRPARERPPRPDRDRLRQARAADRVPAQASRRPGRRADQPRGPQDRRRRRRPAGHRGGRGAPPHQRRRPGHPDRDQHDQPLLAAAPAASSSCASPRATGSWPSPRSAPDLRSRTAWATMANPERTARARPARERADEAVVTAFSAFGGREAAGLYADQFEIYHGNSNPDLARKICRYLGTRAGQAEVFQFANENIFVKILENVREKDVFLVQPTSHPVNQSIMELLIMIDAFKRASAGRITAVIPFYAYGRSDKKDQPRVPITARLIADMITVAGADRVLTMDLHQGQIQGFFNIPVDELTAVHMLSNYYRHKHIEDPVVVTDLGFAKRARTFAELLDAPLAIIEKRRVGNLDRAELMNVIGDVQGQAGDHRRRRDRHGRHAGRDHPGPRARGRHRDLRLRHPRRPERPGGRPDRGLQPARGRPDRLGPAARAQAARQDHDAVRRAAHRRGDPAHPPRRIGRRAVLERGLADPGDAPLGGRRRRHHRHPRRRAGRRAVDDDAAGRIRPGRRPMSLQLHRPDGEGGLEPRPGRRRRTGAPSSSRRAGARRSRATGCPTLKNPEMNPTSRFRSVLFWLGLALADVRAPRRRLRHRASGSLAVAEPDRRRAGRRPDLGDLPYTSPAMRFLSRFVDSNDREIRRLQPLVDETNALEAEIRGPLRRGDPRRVRRAPRRDPRGRRARRAVRGRAPPPRPRAPPRAEEGPPEARERAAPEGARRRPARGLRDDPRGDEADARDAPLRRPADRRRRPPPGQDRRDADRRGQDPRRAAGRRSSTRWPAAASTSSPSTTTSPGATRSGWARSSTSSASASG